MDASYPMMCYCKGWTPRSNGIRVQSGEEQGLYGQGVGSEIKNNRTVVGVDTAKRVFQLYFVEMETGEIVEVKPTRANFPEHFANRAPKAQLYMAQRQTYTVTITRQTAPGVLDTLTTVRTQEPPAEDNQQGVPQRLEVQRRQEEESQAQQGAGDPPVDQGECPSDHGGGENANGEAQPDELEPPQEEEPQKEHAKDASLCLRGTNGPGDLQGGELLLGGKGIDELHGGRGADKIMGGNGGDTYTGGPGADRFVFFSGETGDKIITDFGHGDDRIVLRTEAFA